MMRTLEPRRASAALIERCRTLSPALLLLLSSACGGAPAATSATPRSPAAPSEEAANGAVRAPSGATAKREAAPKAALPGAVTTGNVAAAPGASSPAAAAAAGGAAPDSDASDAPPDPHRFDWCEARRPKEMSPGVTYFFPAKMAQVDTYSVGAVVPTNGRVIHFSGQIPINNEYAVQGTTLTEQLYASLKNLCLAMDEAGVTTADVFHVGLTYVHKDKADPFVLAEEVRDFFEREHPPTATIMAVPILINDQMRVQVEAEAFLPGFGRSGKKPHAVK
jgi:enamine deaminase RidA (YjgF/YER057c/UK114 family)